MFVLHEFKKKKKNHKAGELTQQLKNACCLSKGPRQATHNQL